MHPQDAWIIAIVGGGGLLLGVSLWLAVRWKRGQLLERYRAACRSLGLRHEAEGWVGEARGVRVATSWIDDTSKAYGHQRQSFTSFRARISPPLALELVLFTGLDTWLESGQRHVRPRMLSWHERLLPGAARVNVLDARFCVYAHDVEAAAKLLQGTPAEVLAEAANETHYLLVDRERVELYCEAHETDAERIRRGLDLAARLAVSLVQGASNELSTGR